MNTLLFESNRIGGQPVLSPLYFVAPIKLPKNPVHPGISLFTIMRESTITSIVAFDIAATNTIASLI